MLAVLDHKHLEVLDYFHGPNLTTVQPIMKFTNLRVLDIRFAIGEIRETIVRDSDVQMIILHLMELEELGIFDCDSVYHIVKIFLFISIMNNCL